MPRPRLVARGLLIFSLLGALALAPLLLTFTFARAARPEAPSSDQLAQPQPAPRQADATHIVISEFRWHGVGGDDEFIELYNPTSTSIGIQNWTLWESTCLTSPTLLVTFGAGAAVAPGGHFLIAGQGYSGSATPDIGPSVLGIPDDAGVALVDGLSINSGGTNIVDQVGTVSQADCPGFVTFYEPASLGPLTDNLPQSYERGLGGASGSCVDTNNNSADFTLLSTAEPQGTGDPATPCPVATATPTLTPTSTSTPTATPTATATIPVSCALTPVPASYPSRSVLLNEVAWSGTLARPADEWVELHNTNLACPIDLKDWHLIAIATGGAVSFDIKFDNSDDIPAGGYFVITTNGDVFEDSSIIDRDMADRPAASGTFGLIDGNLTLYLYGPHEEIVDTANIGTGVPGPWPAGSNTNKRSMERYRNAPDTRFNWVTFNLSPLPVSWPRDRNGNFINGSPGMANWAAGITITPSPVPTKGRTPTPRPPTPFAHMVINEFLPRAGTDWNQDGAVNVYDEFIELKNLGPIDVDLANWKIDDVADAGSPPFTLPTLKLKPGERAVFYGLQTRILLDDSGDAVRLINNRGIVIDARTYSVVENVDDSHCRIPDGYYWRLGCFPTPGLENALKGVAPVPALTPLGARPPCLLADTVPAPFREAECHGFGDDIWDRTYWDRLAGVSTFPVSSAHIKWKVSIE
jgi:hypothetical protein